MAFRAFVTEKRDDGSVQRGVTTLEPDDLPAGDVTIRVEWSSVNYKDALATLPDGGVARISPLVPGVDLAGVVTESAAGDVRPGDAVVAHAYDLGVSHHGGFAQLARVPAGWVVPLPDGLTTRDAMAIGTAGFTAALSVERLEARGLKPGDGPVLVTGATGGVGSTAVAMLAARGHHVAASTGKAEEAAFLKALGATEILDRAETTADTGRPLEKERWAGAVDCVGGATLAYVLRTLRYGAAVAASGNTGGRELQTTVFPFILRAVDLLGIDSVRTPIDVRRRLWHRLASDLRPPGLEESITREVDLDGVDQVLTDIQAGRVRGRVVVRLGDAWSAPEAADVRLDGKVAIVTGASRGIGKGLALGLARRGAAVVCAARTVSEDPAGLPGTIHATVDAIRGEGGRALAVRCDIGIADDIRNLVARSVDEFGRVDALVNNAMAPTRGLFNEATEEQWDESMRTNVRSLFLTAKAVVPVMAATGGGSIVNISSGAADPASAPFMPPGYLVYTVAKAALERFSTALAPEVQSAGVAVNALRPGAVKTEMTVHELGEDYDWSTWNTPDSVVPAVAFLAAQDGSGLTGRVLDVSGFGRSWP